MLPATRVRGLDAVSGLSNFWLAQIGGDAGKVVSGWLGSATSILTA